MLRDEGCEQVSVDAVAARAGAGKATVHRRWADKCGRRRAPPGRRAGGRDRVARSAGLRGTAPRPAGAGPWDSGPGPAARSRARPERPGGTRPAVAGRALLRTPGCRLRLPPRTPGSRLPVRRCPAVRWNAEAQPSPLRTGPTTVRRAAR
ncbi:TetR family transcriptional regulator [Streptomyces sp. NPDC097107]|uniref:TetR family transcriptional regulator n=1 Tax=Streptomyces sp. NPDC097107 TaxID=3366089 RepID=UPI0038060BF8